MALRPLILASPLKCLQQAGLALGIQMATPLAKQLPRKTGWQKAIPIWRNISTPSPVSPHKQG